MIATAKAGKSFRALGAYLAEKDESRVGWAETRNTLATDARGAWAEMEADVADSESRVEKPVYHVIISFDPGDEPTEAELRGAVDRTLRDLGLEDHQALAVRHTDTDHDHVHVMVNRVGADGKAWSTSNDAYKLRASVEAQERELGVRWTGKNAARVAVVEKPPVRAAELRAAEPPSKPPPERPRDRGFAAEVRSSALADFREAKTWGELDGRLAARGLRVERRGQGAVVTDGEREAKLSSVSRAVSRGRLESRLGPLRGHERVGRGVGISAPPPDAQATPRESALRRLASPRKDAVARLVPGPGSPSRRAARVPFRPMAFGRKAFGQDPEDPLVGAAQRVGGRALRTAARGAESLVQSLAARRAEAARAAQSTPGAPGRTRLSGLTRVREKRQVERVVALVARVQGAERQRAALGGASAFAGRVDSTVRLAQVASEASQALEKHLAGVYGDPAAARGRVLQAAEQVGPGQAARALAETPERFGSVVQASPGSPPERGWSRLFGKGSPPAATPANSPLRVEATAPLVERAHHTRTAAAQAITGLGRGVGGAELSRAAQRRTERLGHSVEGGAARVRGRAPSESLVEAVRKLSPAQRSQVAERVGQAGLAAVSRSVSAVKALSQGMER